MTWNKIKNYFQMSSKIFLNSRRTVFLNSDRKLPKGCFVNAVEIAEPVDGYLKIVPLGEFPEHPDGPHTITSKEIEEMFANFMRGTRSVLVDYEHNSLWGDTRAAGWSGELQVRNDGLYWKAPEFTPDASDAIKNQVYRFFSPAYFLNAKGKRGSRIGAVLDSVALTNRPYMDTEIDHIRNSSSEEDLDMFTPEEKKKLIAKYKLAEDASDEDIKNAILSDSNDTDNDTDDSSVDDTNTNDADNQNDDEQNADSDDPAANSAFAKQITKTVGDLTKVVEGLVQNNAAIQAKNTDAMIQRWLKEFRILPADEKTIRNSLKADYQGTVDEIEARPIGSRKPGSVKINSQAVNMDKSELNDKQKFVAFANSQPVLN